MNTIIHNKAGDNGISLPFLKNGYVYLFFFRLNMNHPIITKNIIIDEEGNPIEEANNNMRIIFKKSYHFSNAITIPDTPIEGDFILVIPTKYKYKIGIDLSPIFTNGSMAYIAFNSIIGDFSNNVYKCKLGASPTKSIALLSAKLKNTKGLKDCSQMFLRCNFIVPPLFDTSDVENMTGMFAYSTMMTTIPLYNTSKVTNMSYMFQGCRKLTNIPQLDTSKVINMGGMFYDCVSLQSKPNLIINDNTDISNMYTNTPFDDNL